MEIPVWSYVLSMSIYVVLLLSIVELMRKHYKFAAVFWIASLLTFPLWIRGGVVGWFRWSKIISVIIPTIFVGFCRISNYEQKKGKFWEAIQKNWVLWVVYCVLFLNIMEATIKDFTMGNYFNAGCGLLLCLTIPLPKNKIFWKYSTEKPGDLIVFTTLAWNFLYTTWNACFVYAETPVFFASSLCIIFAAEFYPFLKERPELYIMARVYTLATHLIIRSSFTKLFPSVMDASAWHNDTFMKYWGIINLILIVPYACWYFYQIHTGNAENAFIRKRIQAVEA